MTPETTVENPFAGMAEILRKLRAGWLEEAGYESADGSVRKPISAHAGPILGGLASLTTHAEHLRRLLDELAAKDPDAHAALMRAVGRL
jgi:hypothetical protein